MNYPESYDQTQHDAPWCIFNCGVLCDSENKCYRCGWNPAVDAKRKYKILKEMGLTGGVSA